MSKLSFLLSGLTAMLLLAAWPGLPLATATLHGQNQAPTATFTPTLQPSATPTSHPRVDTILYHITLVQHHYNPDQEYTWFTCASRGQGLLVLKPDPYGPRYIGPNDGDFDLWGVVGLFRIDPDGVLTFVPQQPDGQFVSPDNIEYQNLPLDEALDLFASGDAIWTGDPGDPGRIANCDPQNATPTPDSSIQNPA